MKTKKKTTKAKRAKRPAKRAARSMLRKRVARAIARAARKSGSAPGTKTFASALYRELRAVEGPITRAEMKRALTRGLLEAVRATVAPGSSAPD